MRFRTTLFLGGRTATGMTVPAETVQALGSGKKPRVAVTINGYTYRLRADLAAALDAEPGARRQFEALSYSNKRQHVLSIEGAKTPATRQRRVAKALTTLLDLDAQRGG
ncbi:YdeI/OmpD-associated family protein [Micromonospora sp. RHAY321]|uniref:YdeI/OmpD-associated family protein n=1 Tax=Micromonospora sp. RHAY321 TaxID=2944807 RepID=UPI00207C23DB|nr:YdeI/OmpD-associated family protein [Micromonospora sp. RHAY321]MCO1594523.1 YdeI/OmpD-associated family protein [Micromonospora sp. RHAY321]